MIAPETLAEHLAMLAEERRRQADAVASLDARVCLAVAEARLRGASLGDVAEVLGVSRPAVRKMYDRAVAAGYPTALAHSTR